MNERIKELRNYLSLTLDAFGNNLGVTRAAISNIERGTRNVTEQMISSILKTSWNGQRVNEEWLRNGTGDMFTTLSKEARLGEAIARLGELPMITEILSIIGTEASDEFLIELESLIAKCLQKKGSD